MDHAAPHSIPGNDKAPSATEPTHRQVPWEKRDQIGSFRAYWRSAMMVMTRPGELTQFLDAPICEKHAKKFRRVTFQLTFIITMGVLVALFAKTLTTLHAPESDLRGIDPATTMILQHMGVAVLSLVGLFLATRSLEWFSRPKVFEPIRQDRAIALSCYLCGPVLAVTVVWAVASLPAILASGPEIKPTANMITLTWWAIFLAWWPAAARAIHFTTGRNAQRTAIAAITLPLIWTGQQLLVAFIPISVLQWYLIISSTS